MVIVKSITFIGAKKDFSVLLSGTQKVITEINNLKETCANGINMSN